MLFGSAVAQPDRKRAKPKKTLEKPKKHLKKKQYWGTLLDVGSCPKSSRILFSFVFFCFFGFSKFSGLR
jgi:hypothetical protein